MSNTTPAAVGGLVWYERADYEAIKQLMDDGDRLPDTYERWLEKTLKLEREARKAGKAGKTTVRAVIKPDEFRQWCHARGLAVDAKARVAFASWVAKQMHAHRNRRAD